MSDHFDITLERKLESKPAGGDDEPQGVRRIELITGTGRRRRWSTEDKARILLDSFTPGANVSDVARRNGLSPQQLFAWRREARALFEDSGAACVSVAAPASHRGKGRQESSPSDASPQFVPVVMAASAPSSPPPGCPPMPAIPGSIEIVIGDAVVRVIGKVEASALAAVLVAVRRAS